VQKNHGIGALFALLCATASLNSPAQAATAATQTGYPGEQLKLVVILARHGVRSPTWEQERLNSYSALPWPKWDVPPGNLTARGYKLVQQFGSFDRTMFAQEGLLSAKGCADASKTYIWADTDQRTIASGKAFADGLFPSCPPEVFGLKQGENDPLFHPVTKGTKTADSAASSPGVFTRANLQSDSSRYDLLSEMQNVLRGCDRKAPCTPAHPPQLPLLAASAPYAAGNEEGTLALASSFSEDFLLEYADGMPMDQVGWGKVDEQQLRRFLALHSDYFDQVHRTPALARAEASNLLAHVTNTLEQEVDKKPVTDAVGPLGAKLVVLSGHDTNLAGIAALLGVHWSLDGRNDDTPPGTELAFELWKKSDGRYLVRVSVAMQTLRQLREMPELTIEAPPAREKLLVSGCDAVTRTCEWERFRMKAIGTTSVNH
jgi:4-phytase/acid phosphatase